MAVTEEFVEQVSEALDQLGYSVEQEEDVISDVSQIDDDVTLPGIRVQGGKMTGYVSMKLAVLKQYLDNTVQTIQQTWNAWFSDVLPTGVRSIWNTWFGTSDQEGVRKTWGDWFTARSTEWGTLKIDAQTATTNANTAATAAQGATAGAENVNAGLQGFTVTITDRNGVSRSVDIGFDIYRTYASVAAMNADAANVPQGKFVIIATPDKTSEENARMYIKNSQGSFTFLCDLDQASSEAWADWLNNMKPAIQQATTDANSAATNANNKATLAQTAADNANTSRQQIEANEQTRQSNEQARVAAETQRQTDWTNWFSDTLPTGVRKLWGDFWSNVNTSWDGFFGANESSGVRGDWNTLRADVVSKTQAAQTAASNANTAASNADSKATLANNAASNANDKAALANDKASLANEKAALANEKAAYANSQGNYAKAQGDYAKEWNDHPPFIGDGTTGDLNFWYLYDVITARYVKGAYAKGDDLDYSTMTPEEKQRLIDNIKADLVFASVETCEAIIDEI